VFGKARASRGLGGDELAIYSFARRPFPQTSFFTSGNGRS
jgi:hypothetical protein